MGNAPSVSSLNGGKVGVCFCYRGPSPDGKTDVWQSQEVVLRIVCVKGPASPRSPFGPTLPGVTFSLTSTAPLPNSNDATTATVTKRSTILDRVGVDRGVHVSGDKDVVFIAVANKKSSTIVLSNRCRQACGF